VSIANGTEIHIEATVTVTANNIVFHASRRVLVSTRYSMNLLGDDIRFMAT
jgi:hypothetical protein